MEMVTPVVTEIPDALANALSRSNPRCVLFVGAGLSTYTLDSDGNPDPMPTGTQLAEKLAQKIGIEYRNQPLSELAEFYEIKEDRVTLHDWLVSELKDSVRTPGPEILMYAMLPFKGFVTTNYDTQLEQALRSVNDRQPAVHSKGRTPPAIDPNEATVLKISGDIHDRESIFLTDEDYSTRYDEINAGVLNVVRDWLESFNILYIGYSLSDQVHRDELFRVHNILGRFANTGFAVIPNADQWNQAYWSKPLRQVRIIQASAHDFLIDLKERIGMSLRPDEMISRIAHTLHCSNDEAREYVTNENKLWGRDEELAMLLVCQKLGVKIDDLDP